MAARHACLLGVIRLNAVVLTMQLSNFNPFSSCMICILIEQCDAIWRLTLFCFHHCLRKWFVAQVLKSHRQNKSWLKMKRTYRVKSNRNSLNFEFRWFRSRKCSLKRCIRLSVVTEAWIWFQTGSGNGLLPDNANLFPELMLTDLSWMRFWGTDLRPISLGVLKISNHRMSSKNTLVKLLPHPSGAIELN